MKRKTKPAKKLSKPRKRATMSKAVAVRKEPQRGLARKPSSSLAKNWDLNNPELVLEFGRILKDYIVKNNLSVLIKDHQYAKVSAWQFTGNSFGLSAIPKHPVQLHQKGEYITTMYVQKEFLTRDKKPYTKEVPVFIGFSTDRVEIEAQRSMHKITREMTRPHYAYECECEVKRLSDGMVISFGLGKCSNVEEDKATMEDYAINSTAQTRSIGKAYRNLLGFVMESAGYQPTPAEEMQGVVFQDAQVIQDESKVLPFPSEERFKQICEKVLSSKEVTIDVIKKHWQLTPDQEKALEVIQNNRRK